MSKRRSKQSKYVLVSVIILVSIIIGSWAYLIVNNDDLFDVFNQRNMKFFENFVQKMFGKGAKQIAYTDSQRWKEVLLLCYDTIAMSVLATGLAAIGTLITVIPASSNFADGKLTVKKTWYGKCIFYIIRFIYIFTRSVPELVWGMIFIFFIRAGILPGALALALHNFGILGRLCAEVIEDINIKPIQSLSRCGANAAQILMYGIIPSSIEKFLYYMLYRFEVIVRSTIVVGAVGAGGLGLYFKLKMSALDYTGVTLVIICYLLVVYATDITSSKLRKLSSS